MVDLDAASQAVARSVEKAEHTSGVEIMSALVSLAGSNVSSVNSRGVVGVSGRVIDQEDVARAVDAARAVAIPHNREVVHVIQRGFNVDNQDGIRMPLGMHGYRLEVETHIITATAASVENLRQSVAGAGVDVAQFVLNPLASGEEVLTETERQMGVVVCDLGGGTTDIAIYVDGDVWHTAVLAVGGNHITSDIAQVLRLPNSQAEEIKLQHGNADVTDIDAAANFQCSPLWRPGNAADFAYGIGTNYRRKSGRDLWHGGPGDQTFRLRWFAACRHGIDRRRQPAARYTPGSQPGAGCAGAHRTPRELDRYV